MNILTQLLADRRTRRTEDNVERLRKDIAQHDADQTYHARMTGFYSEEMSALDPYTSPESAQRFATTFKKQQDSFADMEAAAARSREANAKLAALA